MDSTNETAQKTGPFHGRENRDVEKLPANVDTPLDREDRQSAFKGLGLLDRLLALWILLAMAIGIILGNFVPNTGPAIQKGQFVGVSIPIGKMNAFVLDWQWLIFFQPSGFLS